MSPSGAKTRLFTVQCDKVSVSFWSNGQVLLLPIPKGSFSLGFIFCNATPGTCIRYLTFIASWNLRFGE